MSLENIEGLQPAKPKMLLPFLDEMSKHANWCGKLRSPVAGCTCPAESAQHEAARIRQTLADSFRLSDPLADWINRAGPALKDLLDAYERRVRSVCANEAELAAEPWKCTEWLAAKAVLDDKPVAVVEVTYPSTNHPFYV